MGAILQNEENYWTVAGLLSVDSFANEDHQKMFAIIQQLAVDGRSIRVPIIAGRISGQLGGMDPEAYLSMLLHMAGREEQMPLTDYAYELRDVSTRRRIITLAENIAKTARDISVTPERVIERAAERLSDIANDSANDKESTISSTVGEIIQASSDNAGSKIALKPCLIGLEEMIGFYPPGSLVLWGGGPGSGKTAMAMQQLMFTGRTDRAYLFELEMDNRSLVARSISGETGVSVRDVMRGLNERQLEKFFEAKDSYQGHQLTMLHKSPMNIDAIRFSARSHKRRRGLRMMVVDHLKLIERHSKYRMDPVERSYQNARDLKELAKELDCVVIALCQFTKSARQKEQPEPEMEDFYGGSLEEHADIMLANFNRWDWLGRNTPKSTSGKAYEDWLNLRTHNQGKIEVFKLKDRFGSPRDRKIFRWDGAKTRYYDIETNGIQTSLGFEEMEGTML